MAQLETVAGDLLPEGVEANAVTCHECAQDYLGEECPKHLDDFTTPAVASETPLLGDERDRDYWHFGHERYVYPLLED